MNTKPVYGVIAYFGGNWTVNFEAEIKDNSRTTSSVSGYGEFPFDRFPGIPVINYQNNDAVFQAMNIPLDEMPRECHPENKGTLESYLNKIRELGIEVL